MMLQIVLLSAALASSTAAAAADTRWELVWADEFDADAGTKPDPAKWTYDLGGGGWGNRELEVYTSDAANAFHDGDGHLIIRAIRNPNGSYTSARLKTQGLNSIRYGKIEARLKLPFGRGIWPAFWALGDDIATVGWPKCGEIDLMENVGIEPYTVHGTVHGPGYSGGDGIGFRYTFPDGSKGSDGYHVYSAEWNENRISFAVDGVTYGFVIRENLPAGAEWAFDKTFFLLLNLAVGGNWPGNPDSTTTFPQDYLADWIRVWKAVPVEDSSRAVQR